MPKSKVRKKRPQPRSASESAWRNDAFRRPGYASWGRPGPSGPGEFDRWIGITWTLRWTLLVTVAAVCTTVILALVLGAQERDLQAFENAPICAAGQSVGCQVDIPVTIEDRGQSGNTKDPTYYVDLSGAAPADGEIDLPGQTALWNSVIAGDGATAIVWNGAVVRIEDDGVEGDTSQAIGVQAVLVQGLLIAAIAWVAASLIFTARVAQMQRGDDDGWTRVLVPLEIPAFLAPLFFAIGALIGQETESLTLSIALGAGFTACGGVFVIVHWLRNR